MNRFSATLLRNLSWVVVSIVVVPLVAAAIGHSLFKTYTATAAVWVDGPSTASSTTPGSTNPPSATYAATLSELLSTRAFQQEVLDQLVANKAVSVSGPAAQQALLDQIGAGVSVSSNGDNLVDLSFKDAHADFAVSVVAAVLSAGHQETTALRTQAISRAATLYQQQVQQAQNGVEVAQQRLDALGPEAPAAVRQQAATDLQVQQDLLKSLQAQQGATYTQSVTEAIGGPSMLRVIDAPQVDGGAKTTWVDVALAAIAALLVVVLVDLLLLTLLMLGDHVVHNAADLAPLVPVPVLDLAAVRPTPEGGRLSFWRRAEP
jgi:hypothetical protein